MNEFIVRTGMQTLSLEKKDSGGVRRISNNSPHAPHSAYFTVTEARAVMPKYASTITPRTIR